MACLTWLWMRKTNDTIRRCVNHDIARKICDMIKVVLTGKVFTDTGDIVCLVMSEKDGNVFWYWKTVETSHHRYCTSLHYRPCVQCLRPVSRRSSVDFELYCNRHPVEVGHEQCCAQFAHSMAKACFNRFRDRYALPDK